MGPYNSSKVLEYVVSKIVVKHVRWL